jgi:hypothetical protein
MLRTLGVGLFAACLGGADAFACRVESSHGMIFFETVPSGVDAPIIARLTVIRLIKAAAKSALHWRPDEHRYSYEGLTRVDEVLKGTIDAYVVKLIAPASSCDSPFRVGAAGIVLGQFRPDGRGRSEFVAISLSRDELRIRKSSADGVTP